MIAITVATIGAAVVALTWLVTTAAGYLPSLYASSVTRQTLAANYTNAILGLWYATALGLLFLRKRTILDLWLIVTLVAWVPNFLLAAIVTSVRFSLGWYSARVYALIASWTLLIVLLTETAVLYARLANALTLRKRERADRLLSVDAATAALAHELGNPLGSIAMNAATALMYLQAKPPAFKDINQVLEEIEAQSHRVGRIISSVRAMFSYTTDQRMMVHIEDVARQVLILLRDDLRINNISIVTDFRDDVPQVHADHTQIQQVILNLVKNAVEAMGSTSGTKRLRLATSLAGNSTVVLSIEDSGGGISRENQERIFDAFFTTKPAGMGLGLAICRTIVENHGGSLQIAKSDSDGSIFEVAMPTAPWQPH
jgi:signal transduction histidine kinase